MASFAFFDNSTTAQALTDGEFGVVGAGTTLAVTGLAVAATDDVLLSAFGRLTGSSTAVQHTGGGIFTMTIGTSAQVRSQTDDTIQSVAADRVLFANAGRVVSQDDAVDLRATGVVQVENSGEMVGVSDGLVVGSDGPTSSIVNTGSITGGSGGIDNVSGSCALVNRGQIVGSADYGYHGAEATDSILNTGTIRGGVFLFGSGDQVDNRGSIDLVEMGNGADLYIAAGKGQAGLVSGGGGADMLIGGRQEDVFEGGAGGDEFVFRRNGGDDRIRDFHGADQIDMTDLGLVSFPDLKAAVRDVGNGCLIDLEDDFGLTIRLIGVEKSELHASDFQIAQLNSTLI